MSTTKSQLGWKETTLGEVAEILSGGTPSTKESAYWDGNIPWITPKDLSGFQGMFIDRGERNITEDGCNNSSAKKLQKNTILFSSRAPIGYVAIANNEVTTNQGFKNVFCDEKTVTLSLYIIGSLTKQNSLKNYRQVLHLVRRQVD